MGLTVAERQKRDLEKKREKEKLEKVAKLHAFRHDPKTIKTYTRNRKTKNVFETEIKPTLQESNTSENYCRCCFVSLSGIDLQKTIDDVFLAFWDMTEIALEQAPNANTFCMDCYRTILKCYEFKGLAILRQEKFKEMMETGGDIGEINKLSLPSDFWEELKKEQNQQIAPKITESQQNSMILQEVKEEPYEYQVIEENCFDQKMFVISNVETLENFKHDEDPLDDVKPDVDLLSTRVTRNGDIFNSKELLKEADKHLEKQDAKKFQNKFEKCSICRGTYKNLSLHMKAHIKKCLYCPFSCSTGFVGLTQHVVKLHLENKMEFLKYIEDARKSEKVSCAYCGIRIVRKGLRNHVRQVHLKIRNRICDYCGFTCFDKHSLLTHMKNHLPKIECSLCDYSTAFKKKLENHFKTRHLGEKIVRKSLKQELPCHECGRIFRNEKNRVLHMKRMHEKLRNYKCDDCERSFYLISELRIHRENVHLPKKLVCEICGRGYGNKVMLAKHKKTHLDATFECDQCDKKFTLENMLKRHINRVHLQEKPYKCTYTDCNREFFDSVQLKTHIRSTHLGIKFHCVLPGCNTVVGRRDNLSFHARQTHKLSGKELDDYMVKLREYCKQMKKEGKL